MVRRMGWLMSAALTLAGTSGCGLLCDRYCDRFHDRCDRYYHDRGSGCAPQPTGCYSGCSPAPGGVYTAQPQGQYCP